eukprot:scaffold3311_cov411-Prasinococcus_capsulatus_cf.AAC.9
MGDECDTVLRRCNVCGHQLPTPTAAPRLMETHAAMKVYREGDRPMLSRSHTSGCCAARILQYVQREASAMKVTHGGGFACAAATPASPRGLMQMHYICIKRVTSITFMLSSPTTRDLLLQDLTTKPTQTLTQTQTLTGGVVPTAPVLAHCRPWPTCRMRSLRAGTRLLRHHARAFSHLCEGRRVLELRHVRMGATRMLAQYSAPTIPSPEGSVATGICEEEADDTSLGVPVAGIRCALQRCTSDPCLDLFTFACRHIP